MQWAIANGCAIFTHDLDFGTMLALSGAPIYGTTHYALQGSVIG
jgi:predicted nuclease of predicted toxin-antitoxin system